MTSVGLLHLRALYAGTDDPWAFRTSAYEAAKFDATAAALPRGRYASALEIGCGNGELARRLASRCESYTGLDAVPSALDAARRAVPEGRFVEAFLPCALPTGPGGASHDLVVLSEVLYFLDRDGIAALATQIDLFCPAADVVVVTWLGDTGNPLGGSEALEAFARATHRPRRIAAVAPGYRIDLFAPSGGIA